MHLRGEEANQDRKDRHDSCLSAIEWFGGFACIPPFPDEISERADRVNTTGVGQKKSSNIMTKSPSPTGCNIVGSMVQDLLTLHSTSRSPVVGGVRASAFESSFT